VEERLPMMPLLFSVLLWSNGREPFPNKVGETVPELGELDRLPFTSAGLESCKRADAYFDWVSGGQLD